MFFLYVLTPRSRREREELYVYFVIDLKLNRIACSCRGGAKSKNYCFTIVALFVVAVLLTLLPPNVMLFILLLLLPFLLLLLLLLCEGGV